MIADTVTDDGSLLLITHVPVRQGPRGLQIDDQTAAGIAQWCHHFDRVTYYGIASADTGGGSSTQWVDTDEGVLGERAVLRALPHAYHPARMAHHYKAARAELAREVRRHRHLCFTVGNILGDWPAVGALEAIEQKRRYAAWIDRVEPFVIRNKVAGSPLRRLAAEAILPVTQRIVRHILRHSSVALLQGGDTYEFYARYARDAHCTYDTHTDVSDQISPEALSAKQARVLAGEPLDIVYVGRAAAMKGPFDWLRVLEQLHAADIPFRATWVGDGPDLAAMRQRVEAAGLQDAIDLPGFENRREVLLDRLRGSDLLLFCHKTPESARCLVESLVAGCPLVGYETAYPRGLVAERGGGAFVPPDDISGLVARLRALHEDRSGLADLMGAAAASGELYNEDAVYAFRADLMKKG